MIRILDEKDNELQIEDVDLEIGYLEPEQLFKEHHDAVEAQEREFHYAVTTFYFEDNTRVDIEDENDPRVGKDDIYNGRFHYETPDGEESRQLRGIDLREVEDVPAVEAKEAWDEYEEIQRYKLYTEEELEERAAEAERKRKEEELLVTGLDRIEAAEGGLVETNEAVEDLILVMADLFGGEEEEEEVE